MQRPVYAVITIPLYKYLFIQGTIQIYLELKFWDIKLRLLNPRSFIFGSSSFIGCLLSYSL